MWRIRACVNLHSAYQFSVYRHILLDTLPAFCFSSPIMNILFSQQQLLFSGPHGSLRISDDDVLSRRLAMLLQGQCEDSSVSHAAALFGYSRQRYYQLLQCFEKQGTLGLLPDTPGPKSDYRRTEQIIRLVIRYRFLDPDCSVDVVAQKLRQQGHTISTRSVERIVADYGLQKKTLRP
jgi:transposase